MTDTIADYQFPKINPDGPIPAPNAKSRDARPALRAGRELSAYGDMDYPESCLQASRTGDGAYGNMREIEANPSDSAQFESFDTRA